jgi:hypothetical protein
MHIRIQPFFSCALLALALSATPIPGDSANEAARKGARIFEGAESWLHPERVVVADRELVFDGGRGAGFRNESLYLTGRFNGGWAITIGFFGWSQGFLQGWGLYALVAEPDGTSHYARSAVSGRNVRLSGDRLRIQAGDNLIEGSRGWTRVRLALDGISCDLRFRNLLPPWKPGDGLAYLTEDQSVNLRVVVPAPWAELSGVLKVGGRTVPVRGDGYADLSVMRSPPDRTNSPVLCLRALSPEGIPAEERPRGERWFLSAVEHLTHPAYGSRRVAALILARGGETPEPGMATCGESHGGREPPGDEEPTGGRAPADEWGQPDGSPSSGGPSSGCRWVLTTPRFSLDKRDLARVEGVPYPYPTRLALRAEDRGYLLEGEIRITRLYYVTDLFADLPGLVRAIALTFSDRSVIFRFQAEFRGTLYAPTGEVQPLRLSGLGEYLVSR